MLIASLIILSSSTTSNEANFNPAEDWMTPYAMETLASGSIIVDMGQVPQTIDNTLKAYGLIYYTTSILNIPMKWVINPNKAKDGTDFTYNGVNYKGAPFIIPGEFVTPSVLSLINTWNSDNASGALNLEQTTTAITVPVYSTITYYPTWTLDKAKGAISAGYIINAGIPESAYNYKDPQDLDCCDQLFAMPHADPKWDTHSNLFLWNLDCNGSLWSACHAVSALENSFNPSDPAQQMNFLSNKTGIANPGDYPWAGNSLLLWEEHLDGSLPPPYITETTLAPVPGPLSVAYNAHPIMQYMGLLDGAQENGSEQVYMPYDGTSWRPTTAIAVYDDSQDNVLAGDSPGKAAKLAFGDGFGDANRGRVMYEAGHVHDGSKDDEVYGAPEFVAAQRAFHNFSLWALEKTKINIGDVTPGTTLFTQGQTENFSVSPAPTGGAGMNYNYAWKVSPASAGTFDNPGAATPIFTATSSVTMPIEAIITVVVTDNCGTNVAFNSLPVTIISGPPMITPVDDVVSICEDYCLESIDILGNDNFVDETLPLSVSITSIMPATARVEVNGDNSLKYWPSPDFNGTITVVYEVCDATTLCGSGTLTLTVDPDACGVGEVCLDPVAAGTVGTYRDEFKKDDGYNQSFGTIDWSSISWIEVGDNNNPADGDIKVNNKLELKQPGSGDYIRRVMDLTDIIDVDISFKINDNADNASPTNQYLMEFSPDGATPYIVVHNFTASDANGSTITANDLQLDANWRTPNALAYIQIRDNGASKDVKIEDLEISIVGQGTMPCGDPCTNCAAAYPEAVDDGILVLNTSTASSLNVQVLSNDTEPNDVGDLTISLDTDLASPTNGTLTLLTTNGNAADAVDIITYTPDAGFTGINTFEYRICDTECRCDMATVTIDVQAAAPMTMPDNIGPFATCEPLIIDVLTNDIDPNGGSLLITSVQSVMMGADLSDLGAALEIISNGTTQFVRYTPPSSVTSATDMFTYTVNNGIASVTETVTVVIDASIYVNLAPTPMNDVADPTIAGDPAYISVLANDSDPEGYDLIVNSSTADLLASAVFNGAYTGPALIPDDVFGISGTGQISFFPPVGYLGTVTFTYEVCDIPAPGSGCSQSAACNTAMVEVNVYNQAPIAFEDMASTGTDQMIDIPVLDNDTEPDGNPFDAAGIMVGDDQSLTNMGLTFLGGMVSLNPDGTIQYTPPTGVSNVTDNFYYKVCDVLDATVMTAMAAMDSVKCDITKVTIDITEPIDLTVTKTVFPTFITSLPQNITYTIVAENTSGAQATNVSLDDDLPAGVTFVSATVTQGSYDMVSGSWYVGTLDPTDIATLDIVVTLNDVNDSYNFVQVIGADQSDTDSSPGNNMSGIPAEDDESFALVLADADLELSKTASTTTPTIGEVVTFTLTITNQGISNATGVEVQDLIPDGYINIGSISNGGTYNSGTKLITWSGLSIPASGTNTIDITFDAEVVRNGTSYDNNAQITASDQGDPDSDPNTGPESDDLTDGLTDDDEAFLAITPQEADLSLTKTVSPTMTMVGGTVTFTIEIANAGPDDGTGIEITDVVPLGFSTQVASISDGGTYSAGTQTITWTGLSALNGGTKQVTFSATVNNAGPTEYINSAYISASDQQDPDSNPETGPSIDDLADGVADDDETEVEITLDADLGIVKTASVNSVMVGDNVTYTIEVENFGPADATGVVITDILPAGLSLVSTTGCAEDPNGSSTCTLGNVSSGSTVSFQLVATVTQSGIITNTASVTGDQPDPNNLNDSDDETITGLSPSYTVEKSISDIGGEGVNGRVDEAGDIISYDIVITNTGNVDINDAIVSDPLLVGPNGFLSNRVESMTFDGVLQVGETWTYTGTYTVQQSDLNTKGGGDGIIENTFAVSSVIAGDESDSAIAPIALSSGIEVTKAVTSIQEAASGNQGNYDVTFEMGITNTGNVELTNISLIEEFETQYGGAFIGISFDPVILPASTAAVPGFTNPSFDGTTTNPSLTDLLDNNGVLQPGETLIFALTAEIDPDNNVAILDANMNLVNTAIVYADAVSGPVQDSSDDKSDLNGDTVNDNETGGGGDPTLVAIMDIRGAKSFTNIVPAANGMFNHFDVTIQLVVQSTGNDTIVNIGLVDSIGAATNFGTAFVGIVSPPIISGSTALVDPGINPLFDGVSDYGITDTTGTMAPGQRFVVTFVAQVNLDAAGAPVQLSNGSVCFFCTLTVPDPKNKESVTRRDNHVVCTDGDLCDAGVDPVGTNPGVPGDTGGADDSALLITPPFPCPPLVEKIAVVKN